MKTKLLFLDVDGVLNHVKCHGWMDSSGALASRVLDDKCIKRLKRIVDSTGCKIILSSSWRHSLGDPLGLSPYLAERLAEHNLFISEKTGNDLNKRSEEIQEYLDNLSDKNYKYAVLDDDSSANLGDTSFFRTSFMEGGLTDGIANAVIEYLNSED